LCGVVGGAGVKEAGLGGKGVADAAFEGGTGVFWPMGFGPETGPSLAAGVVIGTPSAGLFRGVFIPTLTMRISPDSILRSAGVEARGAVLGMDAPQTTQNRASASAAILQLGHKRFAMTIGREMERPHPRWRRRLDFPVGGPLPTDWMAGQASRISGRPGTRPRPTPPARSRRRT